MTANEERPTTPFSTHMRHVALILAIVVALIFVLNRVWLRDNVLTNSPSFDALVYQNQSYVDYLLIREKGPMAVFRKYTSGAWHVPPLYMLTGTVSYLFMGRDPANFYIFPAICFFAMGMAVYGFIYNFTRSALWSWIGCLLLFTTPSMLNFGLRVSQTDFAVGAWFTLATFALVADDGLKTRRGATFYAVCAAVAMLIKSSIVPYFLAHVAIWGVYTFKNRDEWKPRLVNALIMAALVLAMTGWYFFTNIGQIIGYYTEWGGKLSEVTRTYAGIKSPLDDWLFYLRAFKSFHLRNSGLAVKFYLFSLALSLAAFGAVLALSKETRRERTAFGILVAIIWYAIPYIILSLFKSKAAPVDIPIMAVYYVIPVLACAAAFKSGKSAPFAAAIIFGPLLAIQSYSQVNNLFIGRPYKDWREREALEVIFKDAEKMGISKVTVGNAFIHTYLTSENLRFFVLNGEYGNWINRYGMVSIGYYDRAEDFYNTLLTGDYVMTKSSQYIPPSHPDNVIATATNALIEKSPAFISIARLSLPDGSYLTIFRNAQIARVEHPDKMQDGWIGPRFPIKIFWDGVKIRLSGKILLPKEEMYPATVFFEDEQGRRLLKIGEVKDGKNFELLIGPLNGIIKTPATVYLNTDRVYRPSDYTSSQDTRELSMILGRIETANGPLQ